MQEPGPSSPTGEDLVGRPLGSGAPRPPARVARSATARLGGCPVGCLSVIAVLWILNDAIIGLHQPLFVAAECVVLLAYPMAVLAATLSQRGHRRIAEPGTPAPRLSRMRRLLVIWVPYAVIVALLYLLAFPAGYTAAAVRSMPETSLHYPGSVEYHLQLNPYIPGSGFGFFGGGDSLLFGGSLDSVYSPPVLIAYFSSTAAPAAVLSWYRSRLSQLGWEYAGCHPDVNAADEGPDFSFDRSDDSGFDQFDLASSSFEFPGQYGTTMSLQEPSLLNEEGMQRSCTP